MFSSFSLRQWLTVPYVTLVLTVAGIIGALSYRTGSEAVDTLSQRLLLETVHRIEQAVDRHLVGSAAVLEAAFPGGLRATDRVEPELEAMRTRMWAATSLHTDPNNYVYYGNEAGQTVGVYRTSADKAELRVRLSATSARQHYALTSIDQPLPVPTLWETPMDPRQRPWYKNARDSKTPLWTSVYIDFNTRDLVVTRARMVNGFDGKFQGVVATDVALQKLNNFVRSLPVSTHGIAFVIEPDGQLIASSSTPNVRTLADGSNSRINAADSINTLQVMAYQQVREYLARHAAEAREPDTKAMVGLLAPVSLRMDGPDGSAVQLAFSRLRDDSGLDWLVVVAVPRNDFMQNITANVLRTAAIGVAAALLAAGLGLLLLNWLSADLRVLTRAAQRVGEGHLDEDIQVSGRGGITTLTRAFRDMQLHLRTDALTGLDTRDLMLRRINERLQTARRAQDARPFVLLFIDLNHFKEINDRLGHATGDQVLIEIGARLRAALRPGDLVARYAGDEFLALVDNVADAAQAEQVRANMAALLREPLSSVDLSPLGRQAPGGAVGIAMCPGTANSADDLIRQADQDMYRHKG